MSLEKITRAEHPLKAAFNFEAIDIFFAEKTLEFFSESKQEEKIFLAALMAVSRAGHLCLKIEGDSVFPSFDFLSLEKLQEELLKEKIIAGAKALSQEIPAVVMWKNHWYLQRNWFFETKFIRHLKRLLEVPLKNFIGDRELLDGRLNSQQREAIDAALHVNLSLITGGPGTGKSFVAVQLARLFLNQGHSVVIAAPTGKAAAHLEAQLEKDAQLKCGTLHALLEVRSASTLNREGGFLFADLLIVDECSMIDVRLFSYLLASLREGTRIVLMGDENQLPPVESGSLFADLLFSAKKGFPLCARSLTQCMRSERQEILSLAEAIEKGESRTVVQIMRDIEMQDIWQKAQTHFFAPSWELPTLPEKPSFAILSCMRRGPLGVDALNQQIAARFLDDARAGQYVIAPILITRNDYRLNVYNGQMGFFVRRLGYEKENFLLLGDRKFLSSDFPVFEYAYVLSVHKSQGSEYEKVLLLIPKGSEVFGHEVLYTAVTRAKKEIEIAGCPEVVRQALARSSRKISALHERLTERD
jgi:exodeoxyribonuclease V alpha subunit